MADYPFTPISDFGLNPLLSGDTTTNQHSAFQAALNNAYAAGLRALWIPGGKYNYEGLINNPGVSLHAEPGSVTIHIISSTGGNCRINHNSLTDITFYGINFISDKTPTTSKNNAQETDIVLRFAGGRDIAILDCEFRNNFGAPILIRSVTNSLVKNCYVEGCYKDSIHITGTSESAVIQDCHVVNGGDDGIAIVGYMVGAGTLGSPKNSKIINCQVDGVKFARGIALVGADGAQVINCRVNGIIPARFNPVPGRFALCGLYIHSEYVVEEGVHKYTSHANKNILVDGIVIENCGARNLPALRVGSSASTVRVSENITILNPIIKNSASHHISITGGIKTNLKDIKILGGLFDNNLDVNGVLGQPGNGFLPGIEIWDATDLHIEGTLIDIATSGVVVHNTAADRLKLKFDMARIGHRPKTDDPKDTSPGRRLVLAEGNEPDLLDLDLDVNVLEQAYVTTFTQPFFLEHSIYWPHTLSRVSKLTLTHDTEDIAVIRTDGNPSIPVTLGANSEWTNELPYPVLFRVFGGTVSKIETYYPASNGYTGGGSKQPKPGRVQGYFNLNPGQTIKVTNTSLPTVTYRLISY